MWMLQAESSPIAAHLRRATWFLKDRHMLQNIVKLDHCALRSFSLSGLFIGRALSLGVGSLKKFFMQPGVYIKTIGWNHMGSLSLLFAYEVVLVKVVRSAHCFLPLLPTHCCVSCRVLCPVNLALKEHLLMILPQCVLIGAIYPFPECLLSLKKHPHWAWTWTSRRLYYLHVFAYTCIYRNPLWDANARKGVQEHCPAWKVIYNWSGLLTLLDIWDS